MRVNNTSGKPQTGMGDNITVHSIDKANYEKQW